MPKDLFYKSLFFLRSPPPFHFPGNRFVLLRFTRPGVFFTLGNSRSLREERDGARQEASELRCAASQVEGGGVVMTDPWDW